MASTGVREAFGSLQHRDYRMLWSGSLFATTAFMMSFMLVPSVAFELTGSNTAAGLAQMGSGLGMFFVSPIGGVIADRIRKKPLVLAGQAVPAVVILVTGLLILSDTLTIALLTLATLIMGLGFAFMAPARQAWVGELVPQDSLRNAVALQQIAMNIAQVAAPLFIAILVGTWLDIGGTYLFMASLFVIVLPLTSRLPNTPAAETETRPIRSELVAGVSYVWSDPQLRTLWLGFVGLVICGFAFQTLLPGLLNELDRPPADIGVTFLVLAVAGLVVNLPLAAIITTRWAWPALVAMGFTMA
ncbi:MAG: MFS transporter, partial [Acidimicrobiales bacterium]